ncbi:MAG: GNAT family N-acetyltransferase [Chthoniobacterales bacterium]
MAPAVSISSADSRNADAAVGMLKAQLEEHEIAIAEEALRGVVRMVTSEPRYGFILLARCDNKLVGIAYAASHLSAEWGGIVGWLEELYILPPWRGRGLGSALLRAVVDRAQELEWRGLELEVVASHDRAVALYERHRFVPLSRTRFSRMF